jgi:hypothetical protein
MDPKDIKVPAVQPGLRQAESGLCQAFSHADGPSLGLFSSQGHMIHLCIRLFSFCSYLFIHFSSTIARMHCTHGVATMHAGDDVILVAGTCNPSPTTSAILGNGRR